MGSHLLPVEQGRLARPGVHMPGHIRSCTCCPSGALGTLGDEQPCVYDCPHFDCLRLGFAKLIVHAHGAMQTLRWQTDQQAVSALILAVFTEAWTLEQIRLRRPLLAGGT